LKEFKEVRFLPLYKNDNNKNIPSYFGFSTFQVFIVSKHWNTELLGQNRGNSRQWSGSWGFGQAPKSTGENLKKGNWSMGLLQAQWFLNLNTSHRKPYHTTLPWEDPRGRRAMNLDQPEINDVFVSSPCMWSKHPLGDLMLFFLFFSAWYCWVNVVLKLMMNQLVSLDVIFLCTLSFYGSG
jgi:hypothetical protein